MERVGSLKTFADNFLTNVLFQSVDFNKYTVIFTINIIQLKKNWDAQISI